LTDIQLRLDTPTFRDVLAARGRIRPYLEPTPLRHYPALSAMVGAEVFVKHENFQPTGAFKVRGGVNLISQLDEEERERGVIAASTGNHGQSVAYAARLFGVKATICAPLAANRLKVASMRELGAEVVLHGADYDEAREHCEEIARRDGYRYIHSGNEPLLIAGVGTHALEILEAEPRLDAIIVPIGGGSGAAGTCVVGAAVNPDLEVIGVQSAEAPASFLSWKQGSLVGADNRTSVEGLSTATAFELPQQILRRHLDKFVLVSDEEIVLAIATMVETTRTLVEAAGASPLAGALKLRDNLRGKRVALICSGANITPEQLREALAAAPD
jgi:threonine dehydratase